MAASDEVETQTPIFTEAEVYLIGGFLAERFEVDTDTDNEMVVEAIEDAIKAALNHGW
jgi:hypothetical protein